MVFNVRLILLVGFCVKYVIAFVFVVCVAGLIVFVSLSAIEYDSVLVACVSVEVA